MHRVIGSPWSRCSTLPAERVEAIRSGSYADLPRRHQVAAEFATQAADDPHRLTDEHFDSLAEAGFSELNVVELIGVVGLSMFVDTYGIAKDLQSTDRDATLATY